MKKILTVSLVAMMAVSAARADIASTDFVTKQTGDVSTLATSSKVLTGAVNELVTSVAGVKAKADAAATASDLSALQGTVSTLSGTVGTNKAAADKTQEDLDALEETVAGLKGTGDQAAATKKELAELTQTVTDNETDIEGKMTTLSGRVDTAEGKIVTLTGAATVDGSVANAKQAGIDAQTALDAYKESNNTALAGKQATLVAGDIKTDLIADKNVTKAKLSDEVQTSLGKADSAVQPAAINDMQVKSNIVTDVAHNLSGEEANQKYTSVSYVDTKVGGVTADLGAVNETLDEHEQLIDANTAAIEGLDGTYLTDAAFDTFKTTNTGEIAAAKKAGTDAQDDLDAYKTSNDAALAGVKTTAEAAVVANSAITPGSGSVITYDAQGLVTSGRALVASDIPTIEQSQVDGLGDALDGKQADSTANYQVGTADGSWMALNANLPEKCQADGVSCSLISVGGNISWEVIAK